jgi:CubicO group peptidase (beta-lactamase class C family)
MRFHEALRGLGLTVLVMSLIACATPHRAPGSPPGAAAQQNPVTPRTPLRFAQTFADVEPAYTFVDSNRKTKLASAFTAIDAIVTEEMSRQRWPGLALGIVIDGDLAHFKGFGFVDLERKTTPDMDTVFRIGSITKSMTAVTALSLRDDGVLALDDPLVRLVPEAAGLRYPTRDAPPITFRQLLTHRSGLPGRSSSKARSEADVLRALEGFPLESAPGATFRYSNLGYALLGIAAGRAARAPFRDVVSKRLLQPLGMTSTVWERQSLDASRFATGYFVKENADPRAVEEAKLEAEDGAGGLYSSVRDMARYVTAQLDAYPPRNDAETGPVRRSTLREAHGSGFPTGLHVALATAPAKGESLVHATADTYAFGWEASESCDFDDLVWHDGIVPGYVAGIAFLRERGVGIAWLANGSPGDPSAVSRRILLALKRTGALSKRSQKVPQPFQAAMKKLLAVYNDWNEDGYRAMLSPSRGGVGGTSREMLAVERDELAGYKERHGACTEISPIELQTARDARFKLSCERGSFDMVITVSPDGFVDGFAGTSHDVPLPAAIRGTAERVVGLIRRWDEATYRKHLARTKNTHDETMAMFARLRAVHAACLVKSSTIVVFDRKLELECERGRDLALTLEVDKNDPAVISTYAFVEAKAETCPVR